jgi:hypothetical protein
MSAILDPTGIPRDRADSDPQAFRAGFYLRLIGTIILVLATADFLLQGLSRFAPAYRYWVMPGLMALFAGCGLVCGYFWRETRGARLFFGLATALVPVQFSQMGAMLRAVLYGAATGYSGWWHYEGVGWVLVAADLAVSLLIAFPVAYAGFSILARPHARYLLLGLLPGCAVFLIPVRDPGLAAGILMLLFLSLRWHDRSFRGDALMGSLEGLAARALVFLPVAILAGRSLFYPWTDLTAAALFGLAGLVLFSDAPNLRRSRTWIGGCEAGGVLFGVLAATSLAESLPGFAAGSAEAVLVKYLATVALLFAAADRASLGASWYRSLGTTIALLGCFVYLAVSGDHSAALLCLGMGTALVYAGITYRQRWTLFGGFVAFLTGLAFYVRYAGSLYEASPWASLTALGVAILLFASFLEKKRQPLVALGGRWWRTVRAWGR